jgi:hypothetical protein
MMHESDDEFNRGCISTIAIIIVLIVIANVMFYKC